MSGAGAAVPGGRAQSQRQLRVGETVRRALADILTRGEHHDPALEGVSVTVSEVRCSPDLRHATVYVMPLGGRDVGQTLEALAGARGRLRLLVGRALTTKRTPDLRFVADGSFDRMDETRAMLAQPAVQRDLAIGAAEDRPEGD
ncbi:MAG: 30S ribosome-binding factor RbfA [Pseudomonadota bacterium]